MCSNILLIVYISIYVKTGREREGLFTCVSSVCGSLFCDLWVFIALSNALSQPSTSALKIAGKYLTLLALNYVVMAMRDIVKIIVANLLFPMRKYSLERFTMSSSTFKNSTEDGEPLDCFLTQSHF